eukprot:3545548-Rhodomonas_salina.3
MALPFFAAAVGVPLAGARLLFGVAERGTVRELNSSLSSCARHARRQVRRSNAKRQREAKTERLCNAQRMQRDSTCAYILTLDV